MRLSLTDTITALASAPGSAGRAVVRCSGAAVREILQTRFVPENPAAWTESRLPTRHPGTWQLGESRSKLPLACWLWPGRRSYTGQPSAELHLVSSPPLIEGLLADLLAAGARLAEPGEFTLRAFLAGRLDLLQAEAVLGVIEAQGPSDLRSALQQLAGGLSSRLFAMREDQLDLLAELEAELDFADEGLQFVSRSELLRRLQSAREELDRLLEATASDWQHRALPRVVLAGLPNAGKSTLFNALAGADRALVSPIAGTTRDYLHAEIEHAGCRWELVDTAGWELTSDQILQSAVRLGQQQSEQAALIVWCQSADHPTADGAFPVTSALTSQRLLPIWTKADLAPATGSDRLSVSASTGLGLAELRQAIHQRLQQQAPGDQLWISTSAARCRDSLLQAHAALTRASDDVSAGTSEPELLASDVREALDSLGQVTGAVYTDDLLDRIFSKFCIGK